MQKNLQKLKRWPFFAKIKTVENAKLSIFAKIKKDSFV
jgi:hypothetical protein